MRTALSFGFYSSDSCCPRWNGTRVEQMWALAVSLARFTTGGGQNIGPRPDQIWMEIRAEEITASQRPTTRRQTGHGDTVSLHWEPWMFEVQKIYVALAKRELPAWTFSCAYIVQISWGCSRAAAAVHANMLTLMHRCKSWFASQSTMSLCLLWQASPWKRAEVPGFQESWEAAGPGGCEGGSVCSALERREKYTTPTCLILWKTPQLVLMSA